MWFAFGNTAFREGYEDVKTWNTVERQFKPVEGRHRFLVVAILFTEAVTCYKYREGTGNLQNNPTSLWVSIPWGIIFAFFGAYWIYLRTKVDRTKKFIEAKTK
jgi:hypothetical protein